MIQFKQIEISDKKTIDEALKGNNYRACDFSFANLFAWRAQFRGAFSIINKTLFLRIYDTNNEPCYLMPVGRMPLKEAMQLMLDDAEKKQITFQMKKVSKQMWEEIEKAMPRVFEFTTDRDNNEYIYYADKLIRLSGKKLQSKRNHINRFKRENPNWEYFPITAAEDTIACKKMFDNWHKLYGEEAGKGIEYDYISGHKLLDNFNELELKGGAIRIKGRVVAFTIGAKLTEDTFVVHLEKAYGELAGAYTIINQQFMEHAASEFTYVNREEDLGLENLRRAKMSYYPDIFLQEGKVEMK